MILAVFLAGLGIGYRVFGIFAKKLQAKQLIKLTGILEILIGLWGILFLFIYDFFWNSTGVIGFNSTLIDVSVISLFILFPTILMGGTLPLLTQGLYTGKIYYGRVHALIYAFNTLGAFVGCVLAGFVLLPAYGLNISIKVALNINIIAGVLFLLISSRATGADKEFKSESHSSSTISSSIALAIAFLAGFYSLSYQSSFIRLAGLSIGASEYAFPLIVGAFILLIAFGSGVLVGRQKRLSLYTNQLILFVSLVVLYFLITYWPYLFYIIRINFQSSLAVFSNYYFVVFFAFLLLLLIPVATMGATLPLLFANIRSEEDHLGNWVGKIYGLNTVGTVLGCLLGGYYLLYFFDLDQVYVFSLALVALTLILSSSKKTTTSLIVAVIVIGSACYKWNPSYLGVGLFHERTSNEYTYQGRKAFYNDLLQGTELIDYKDGPNTSVTILDFDTEQENKSRSILVNGKTDGNTEGDKFTMKLIAHLPALLVGNSSDQAAVIGYGTGMTSGALSLYPDIKEIDNIEISPFVSQFADYFDYANNNVTKNPKNNFIVADAYRYLAKVDKKYSVILSGPTNPWVSGMDRLFTKEFYQIIDQRLAEDGIFLKWISLWGLSQDSVRLILKTLSDTFPNLRFFNSENSLFIVASKQELSNKNIANLKQRFEIEDVKQDLAALNILSPEILLALEKYLPVTSYDFPFQNTLEHTRLGYLAGKDFFRDAITIFESLLSKNDWLKTVSLAKQSLLAKYFQSEPNLNLEHILQTSCEGRKVKLIEPDWRTQRTVCRDVVIAMILQDKLKSPPYLENEVEIVKEVFINDAMPLPLQAENIHAAKRFVRYYQQYNTFFFPLSAKRLQWKLSTCYSSDSKENLECRGELAQVLKNLTR